MDIENNYRFIHLLYVPTMACNMACKYCYLEDNTKDEWYNTKPLDTLEYAVNKFFKSNIKGQVQSPVKVCEVATNAKLYEI